MVASLRSALLICVALSATSVAPARAGPAPATLTSETLVPQDSPQVASVVIPTRLPPIGSEVTPEAQPLPETPDVQTPEEIAPEATVDRNEDLPALVADLRSADPGNHEVECLAAGIYFESKSEPLSGQLAVGKVIANRTHSGRFPTTYCGVLFQPGQFSFIRDHRWPHISRDNRQWQTAVAIAKIVDKNLKDSVAENALYFHARRVHPGWHFHEIASIGNQVFFR